MDGVKDAVPVPMEDQTFWTDDPTVLWRNGKWMKIVPRESQSRPELVNRIARLSIVVAAALALLTRSFIPIGLGMLGILASSQMTGRSATTGGHVSKRKKKRRSKGQVRGALVTQADEQPPVVDHMSWANFFGSQQDGAAMGAYVQMANSQQPQLRYQAPNNQPPAEGSKTWNMVPATNVKEYHDPQPTPPPQPNDFNTWQNAMPFQAGYPTAYGPAPTAFAHVAGVNTQLPYAQQANQMYGPTAFQAHNHTWGQFANDGGYTSENSIPRTPHGTVGQNFSTHQYQPHNLALTQPALQSTQKCVPPNSESPLGNPEIWENRVARPKRCPQQDPRSESTQFIDSLYENGAQQGAGYAFFPFPVADVIQARDNFQKFVYEDGQTHFKDKYSIPNPGPYNFTDQIYPLGF